MKKALLTGATSLLGQELARALAKSDYSLYLTGRNSAILNKLEQELSCKTLAVDLLKDKSKIIYWIETENFDLIIQNAGVGLYGPVFLYPVEEELAIISMNAHIPLELALIAIATWRKTHTKGTLLHISSATDILCYPTFALYSSSKMMLTQASLAIAEEVKDLGITVLVSSPGPIQTAFSSNASKGYFTPKKQKGLSVKEAAKEIIHQLDTKKVYHVFPEKIALFRALLKIFPQKLRFFLLKKFIKNRYLS